MCGIAGFIGNSKNPDLSFKLATNLFSELEARGVDAAGFWGANDEDQIIFHKEPIRSSQLIKKPIWQDVRGFNANLLLLHARQATPGVGHPSNNSNNHPFTSSDKSLCLIHNGRIPEFNILSKSFQVLSQCDSEVLLRIIEASPDYLDGIAQIYSLINHGHMAVALGKVDHYGKRLWLFRNKHRSLWLVDLFDHLGQYFFCSTSDIWDAANFYLTFPQQKLIEIPTEEVWFFDTGEGLKLKRYEAQFEGDLTDWQRNGTHKVQNGTPQFEVISETQDTTDSHKFRKIRNIFEQFQNLIIKESINDREKIISVAKFEFQRIISSG